MENQSVMGNPENDISWSCVISGWAHVASLIGSMLRILVCAAIVTASLDEGFARAVVLDLQQAVDAGLTANPGIEAMQHAIKEAEMNVKAARGQFLPSVTLQSSLSSYTQTGDIVSVDQYNQDAFTNGVKVSLPIFVGFSRLSNYQKAELQVDLNNAKLAQTRLDLIANIQSSFLQLLKANEEFKIVNSEIIRIESQLDAARAFHKAGIGPYIDVLTTEVELAKAEGDKVKILNGIKNFKTQLKIFLGSSIYDDVDFAGDLRAYNTYVSYTDDEAIKTAISHRPDLQIGEKSVQIATKEAETVFSKFLPNVTLDFSKFNKKTKYDGYSYDKTSQYYETLALNMSWKIFDGGSTLYTYKSEQERIKAIRKDLENQIAGAHAKIVQSLTDIDDARKIIAISIKARESAVENFDMAFMRYKTGIGSLNDLLNAQYKLTRAESDLSDSYMKLHIARSTLYYNMGIENAGLN